MDDERRDELRELAKASASDLAGALCHYDRKEDEEFSQDDFMEGLDAAYTI